MDELKEYNEYERILSEDIRNGVLTYDEALERSKEMWGLIPLTIDLNPVGFNNLMFETYGKEEDWGKHIQTFKIDLGKVSEINLDKSYISRIFVPQK